MRDDRAKKPRGVPAAGLCKRPNGMDKQGYRSRAKAMQAIRDHHRPTRKLYVYECKRCGLWHLTGQAAA